MLENKEPKKFSGELGPEFVAELQQCLPSLSGSKARRVYLAIYEQLASGRLPVESRLPASRELARQLSCGRNSVTAAYQQLVDEGLLYTARRGGTRVAANPRQSLNTGSRTINVEAAATISLSHRSGALHGTQRPKSLCPGEPDATLFPRQAWARALAQAARQRSMNLGYRFDAGEPMLREAIARYLASWRSLVVDPAQILITASTRQSLVVAASLYADKNDMALVESPGYIGVQQAWRMMGLKLLPLEVDASGLRCPDDLAGARLLYSTPCFQYPLGSSLAPARRDQLLKIAAHHGTVVFEDDYDSEFREKNQPRPALASDASTYGATVLHSGTFSKLMFPAVRLAWIVLPEAHMQAGTGLLRSMGGGHNAVQQRAVAALLDDGTVAKHLVRARTAYARRRDVLIKALEEGPFSVRKTSGGLSLVLDLCTPLPRKALVNALQAVEIGAQPLEEFYLDTTQSTHCRALVVGTGNVGLMALPGVIQKLHHVYQTFRSTNA